MYTDGTWDLHCKSRLKRRSTMSLRCISACFAAVLTVPVLAFGQAFTGSISGLVTDATGSVVAGVAVTATDIDRNVSTKSASNEQGLYLISPLPPGVYRIHAEKAGFRQYLVDRVAISTQQKAGLDITLEVGAL